MKKIISIVGIGNEIRRDDGTGIYVVCSLKEILPSEIDVIEISDDISKLLEINDYYNKVIIIDAVRSHNNPGKIYRYDLRTQKLPVIFSNYSTHSFNLAEAIELGLKLNKLPPELIIYGIEGKNFETGVGLSDEVLKAVPEIINTIQNEIRKVLKEHLSYQTEIKKAGFVTGSKLL